LPWNEFHSRHIGPRDSDIEEMLKTIGMEGNGLDDFVSQVIPKDVFDAPKDRIVNHTLTESTLPKHFGAIASKNKQMVWMNGRGYYPVSTPAVIKRNLLENPGWYTSYTPYQPEISQGRLESLLNFQTMVSDLTGLPVANASLLDEGTAGAEAMTMSLNCLPSSRQKRQNKTYVVSDRVLNTTIRVLRGRAEGFGINVVTLDFSQPDAIQKLRDVGDDLVGAMVQYPDTIGHVHDFQEVADTVHELGAQLSAATDLSALTILTPPGEWGADIAFGNSQRFGVPLGAGGPHAAFFATKESNKRRLPGRLVGVTKDRMGRPALRLALQTREQHIRREKATSNVCTAQALLANIAAMYAVYHGPHQLKGMALENLRGARMVQQAAQHYGFNANASPLHPEHMVLSDTVSLSHMSEKVTSDLIRAFLRRNISVTASRESGIMNIAVPGHMGTSLFKHIVEGFQACALHNKDDHHMVTAERIWQEGHSLTHEQLCDSIPESVRRKSSYLTHPVFNSHHSETEMLRYLHHLQSKDLSQVHSMIPLGSCTMKLNGTSLLELIGYGDIANIHPFAHIQATEGYRDLIKELCDQLSRLTGMDSTSIQPNSGAQGEFAGLRAIRKYHETQGAGKRDICLIPVSAHGTNPASAAMAGMRTVPIKCDPKTGNLDIQDLREKAAKHADELAAIMITYPSTYGVFEPAIRETCNIVHEHGGLVYMDGANMNAQIGLTSPGALGADVCHLNLHKTFCIPHGGGGPGVGPICVKSLLAPYLPDGKSGEWVTSARYGSASILPISWAYMKLMGKSLDSNLAWSCDFETNFLVQQETRDSSRLPRWPS
jgi:glycine dehydrogenase